MNDVFLTPPEIPRWCDRFSKASAIAVDTEFYRVDSYWPHLALIQLSDGHDVALIDPLELAVDLTPVRRLLSRESLVKIFHSCRQDLEIFLKTFGELPTNLFDTQVAYTFLYPIEEVSLAKLVEEQLGVILNKSNQHTDWLRRPLSSSQLHYAANDVIFLPEIKSLLQQKLKDLGRYEWFEEEQRLRFTVANLRPTSEYWIRLAKRGRHKPQQLHILKSLCDWREQVAQELNYNRRRVLSDEVILQVIETQDLTTTVELTTLPESHQAAFGVWWEEILKTPEDQWPPKFQQKQMALREQERFDRLQGLLSTISTDLNLSSTLIAPTSDLKAYIQGNEQVAFMKGWRADVFGCYAQKI
jgi:ribonuclease D